MKVEQSFIYIANDGKEFLSKEECLKHEKEIIFNNSTITYWKVVVFAENENKKVSHTNYISLVSKSNNKSLNRAIVNSWANNCLGKQIYNYEGEFYCLWDSYQIEKPLYDKITTKICGKNVEELFLTEDFFTCRGNNYRYKVRSKDNEGVIFIYFPEIVNFK